MKVLVTGSNGLLGQNLINNAPNNIQILGIDLHTNSFIDLNHGDYKQCDITQRDNICDLVFQNKPEWIVNTAAITDVDYCEVDKEKCWRLNVHAVENLAYAAAKVNAKIVQLSTDYVFDGKNGPYSEEDKPNPICYYGRSKLASENTLLMTGNQHAIARTAVLYGHGVSIRLNFVSWLISELSNNHKVFIVDDQIGNTTLASELANGIWRIINLKCSGIFHLAGREFISRFAFAQQIAAVFGLDSALIYKVSSNELEQKANRPLFSGILIDKASNTLGMELSDVRRGLIKYRELMVNTN